MSSCTYQLLIPLARLRVGDDGILYCLSDVYFVMFSVWRLSLLFALKSYTLVDLKSFFSALLVVAQNWDLFYFHLSQPKLGLYSFCTLFLVYLWFSVVCTECNFIHRKVLKIGVTMV